MQQGSFTPATPRHDVEGVVNRINLLSEKFRHDGNKIIFVQHDGTKENAFIPGTSEWKFLSTLIFDPSDIVISKTANDSFYETELSSFLKKNGIKDLYITGCATDGCIDSTIHSALVNDYNIVVVRDCHTTTDRPHLSAIKVIEHHEWLWQNMTPTKGKIELILSQEILSKKNP